MPKSFLTLTALSSEASKDLPVLVFTINNDSTATESCYINPCSQRCSRLELLRMRVTGESCILGHLDSSCMCFVSMVWCLPNFSCLVSSVHLISLVQCACTTLGGYIQGTQCRYRALRLAPQHGCRSRCQLH